MWSCMPKKEACARFLQHAARLTYQSLDLGSSSLIVTKITITKLHPILPTSIKTATFVAKMKKIGTTKIFIIRKKVEVVNNGII